MTVAVLVKVYDGIVLAADSATTIELPGGSHQVYNSANKIFHLHRRLPIGAMTWGLGNIGSASIATLAKDLRHRLMGKSATHPEWQLEDGYTVQSVAERLIEHIFDELYAVEFAGQTGTPLLGFLVAGYSHGENLSEAWLVQIEDPSVRPVPMVVAKPEESGWASYAQPEATMRLFKGVDPTLSRDLHAATDPAEHTAIDQAIAAVEQSVVPAPMPLADAIALAGFMVDVTVGYARFRLGPDTVGGPVEVAAISRHEGFKWVDRKHYYSATFNPEVS